MAEVARPASAPAANPARGAAAIARPDPPAPSAVALAAAAAGSEPSTVTSAKSRTLKLMKTPRARIPYTRPSTRIPSIMVRRVSLLLLRRNAAGHQNLGAIEKVGIKRDA